MTPPCKGCAERAVGCHTVCEKYKAYRAEMLEQYEKRLERSEVTSFQNKTKARVRAARRAAKRK
jgi:hypothetical protein